MEELIDIEGLSQVGMLPLAPGWWLIIGIATLGLAVAGYFWQKNFKYRRSWQYKSYSRLSNMEKQLDYAEAKIILQNFSLEMRKIAMLTTKREVCAGLIGKPWLEWLQQHDPKGFDWQENGGILLTAQYMPDPLGDDRSNISRLISAAKNWVSKC